MKYRMLKDLFIEFHPHECKDDVLREQNFYKDDLVDHNFGPDWCEEVKEGRWKPEIGKGYWFVDAIGMEDDYEWGNDSVDEWSFSQGNCFKTKAEATDHKEKLEFVAEFESFWRENREDGVALGWSIKWLDDRLIASFAYNGVLGEYLFNSEQSAQTAIDKFGDKLKMLIR